ncbi:MAG: DNA primase [Phycisphaeraceae bacterium]|nr:MAG: DNA primase [Phycisphaeraceae bacterium]
MTTRDQGGDDVQRVRDASDIVAVVGEVVSLKAKGREYVGLCPFHDDRKPSMYVVPNKQIFHCFACGAGGDVFTFVQRYHAMEFPEVIKLLAERAGIELRPRRAPASGAASGDGPARADLLEANQQAAAFYRSLLTHPEHGVAARELIERRGITPDMIEAFAIGTSPAMWDGLVRFAKSKGLDERCLFALGLLKRRDDGDGYDALRNRLIFPIHQAQTGKVIAFGGRRIDDEDEPKYLNSPETSLFDKSRTLYGLHQASRAIQKQGVAVVVEGYTDVIACHQAGITNVVATLGTALTAGHAALLRRLCTTVVLLFDGDEAGQRAADRAFEVLFSEALDLKIAALSTATDAKDPDELLKRDGGAEQFLTVIDDAQDLAVWHFARIRERLANAGPAARSTAVQEELDRLVSLGLSGLPPVRKKLMVQQIARAAGVDEATVYASIPGGRTRRHGTSGEAELKPVSHKPDARELALGCLLCEGSLWVSLAGEHRDRLSAHAYRSPMTRVVADAVQRLTSDGIEPELTAVLDDMAHEATDHPGSFDPVEAAACATTLRQDAWMRCEGKLERLSEMLTECLESIGIDDALVGTKNNDAEPAPEGDSALERLERLKSVQATYGKNPRVRLTRGGVPGQA